MDSIRNESFEAYVRGRLDGLKPSERIAAEYVLKQPREILFASAGEIGAAAGTSDATVIRMAKALGYSGLPELKRHAAHQVAEQTPPSVRLGSELERTANLGPARMRLLSEEIIESLQMTQQRIDAEGLQAAADHLLRSRAIHTWGIGVSGVAAEYAAIRLRRLGLDARWMAASGFKLADDLMPVQSSDAVMVFVPGRHHSDLDAVVDRMSALGATGLLITSSLGSAVRDRFAVVLRAENAPSKLAGELYSSMMVADALVAELAGSMGGASLEASDTLTQLRRRFS